MARREIESETELTLAKPRDSARLLGRALMLRCPNCGGRPVLRHWLKMRDQCPRCGLRIERGESDYFMGSMLFNLILAELLFAGVFIAFLIAVWPAVPWDAIQFAAPALMLVAPIVLFPFSKLTWLAFDLMLRPVNEAELRWHREERSDA